MHRKYTYRECLRYFFHAILFEELQVYIFFIYIIHMVRKYLVRIVILFFCIHISYMLDMLIYQS